MVINFNDVLNEIIHLKSTNYQALLAGVLILLAYYLIFWLQKPRKKKITTPQQGPPPDFTAAELGYILSMGYHDRLFAAALLALAEKGYLRIEVIPPGKLIDKIFTLTKRNDFNGKLSDVEIEMVAILFSNQNEITLKRNQRFRNASSLLRSFLQKQYYPKYFFRHSSVHIFGGILSLLLIAFGLFPVLHSIHIRWTTVLVIGAIIYLIKRLNDLLWLDAIELFLLAFILINIAIPIYHATAIPALQRYMYWGFIGIMIVINAVFYFFLRTPTRAGRQLMQQILAFKMFLAPNKNLTALKASLPLPMYQEYLSFTVALNVEKAWSARFAKEIKTITYQPDWYHNRSSQREFKFTVDLVSDFVNEVKFSTTTNSLNR